MKRFKDAKWRAEPCPIEPTDWMVKDMATGEEQVVAVVSMKGEDEYDAEVNEPNLQLIKTAPQLYLACSKVLEVMEDYDIDDPDVEEMLKEVKKAVKEAEL